MVNGRGKQTITFSKMEQRLVGGFNHLEKYESQWEGLSHILWKIKNVWNHQPEECISANKKKSAAIIPTLLHLSLICSFKRHEAWMVDTCTSFRETTKEVEQRAVPSGCAAINELFCRIPGLWTKNIRGQIGSIVSKRRKSTWWPNLCGKGSRKQWSRDNLTRVWWAPNRLGSKCLGYP